MVSDSRKVGEGDSAFARALRRGAPTAADGRRWFYVPYDQLSLDLGPHADLPPQEAGLVLVESTWKGRRRPYHRQKLALILANQRHFALEAQERGYAVDYVVTTADIASALRRVVSERGPLTVMEPAERELRAHLEPLFAEGALRLEDHRGWLTTPEQFEDWVGSAPPWRMDAFYRGARRATGLLMQDGKPEGGRFSFDGENRKRWKGEPPAPAPPSYRPDDITLEVASLVDRLFDRHPGRVSPETLPATAADAEATWSWALRECMVSFGPYEDAMSTASSGLFHTRISPLLNLHRLLPERVVREVAGSADLPLPSREGFVRQILGWREFVRHVHRSTDGLRSLAREPDAVLERPGQAGWEGVGAPDGDESVPGAGGLAPQPFGSAIDLPPVFWGESPSGLACLDRVVEDVWREAWSHHITRLMVLSNLATLLDVDARQLTDWFWVAYVDAFDWVVEPNVLGMGTYALGDVMTTKPYVSGAAYIHRMSDYCASCRFDPKTDCPITSLYWDYLNRHRERFAGNPRMTLPARNSSRRDDERKAHDAAVRSWVQRTLGDGAALDPDDAPGR